MPISQQAVQLRANGFMPTKSSLLRAAENHRIFLHAHESPSNCHNWRKSSAQLFLSHFKTIRGNRISRFLEWRDFTNRCKLRRNSIRSILDLSSIGIQQNQNSVVFGYVSNFEPTIVQADISKISSSATLTDKPLVFAASPEPALALLFGIGLLGVGMLRRRKR